MGSRYNAEEVIHIILNGIGLRCVVIPYLVHTSKEVMMMGNQEKEKLDKERQEKKKNKRAYLLSIGFFGGFFASLTAYLAHFLNFIPFGPGIILQMLPQYTVIPWMRGPGGHFIGILVISLFSIGFAYLYYALLRRMDTAWVGVWYGLALWVVLFIGLNQLIPGVKKVDELGWNTNITLLCIFIIYGLFVGYSISYEHKEDEYEALSKGE